MTYNVFGGRLNLAQLINEMSYTVWAKNVSPVLCSYSYDINWSACVHDPNVSILIYSQILLK